MNKLVQSISFLHKLELQNSKNEALSLMKGKLNEEREKFKIQIANLKQNYIKQIADLQQSFTIENENLQECLSISCSYTNTLDERLKIAEEVMDTRYTNHLNQKFIYQTKLKELDDFKIMISPQSLLFEKCKSENNEYCMIIEDLNSQIQRLVDQNTDLMNALGLSRAKNSQIPMLLQQIKTLDDKLGLYSGKKSKLETNPKSPHLYSIYQDIVKLHGESAKEVMKSKNKKKNDRKCVSISACSSHNVHGDLKSTLEDIENTLDVKNKIEPSFYGFVDRTVKSKPKEASIEEEEKSENKASPKKVTEKKTTQKFMVENPDNLPKYKIKQKDKNKKEEAENFKIIERTKYEDYNPQLVKHITMKF